MLSTQGLTLVPSPYGDPVLGGCGSLVAYGPHAINQPQMSPEMLGLGLASNRVALPLDVAEDGPIYVNAKQYHGILRRRQSRAKLEAQNKLIKTRKPYLHESRHRHALNRIRGSGGRFLSAKQLQFEAHSGGSGSEPVNIPSTTGGNASSITPCSHLTTLPTNTVQFFGNSPVTG